MIKLANEADAIYEAQYQTMQKSGAAQRRAGSYQAFLERGLPNRRVESWHYTDLKAALAKPAPLAAGDERKPLLARTHDSIRLVTLDGKFRPDLSDLSELPVGLRVRSLHEALADDNPEINVALWPDGAGAEDAAVALNGALMQDGVVVSVSSGATIARPIEFVTLVGASLPEAIFTRSALIVGAGASVKAIETAGVLERETSNATQLNHLLALRLEHDSKLDMLSHISGFGGDSVSVFSLNAHLASHAQLKAHQLIEGGGLLRRQLFAALDGEFAGASFNGVTLARGRQHADTTLFVDHRQPHGASHERFRTILDEHAIGVFQGKIVVRPGAQKTDGVMQSKAILLSDGATMNNKPELEIFADDVKCGHGAACGRLDQDQLFYLMARGLPRGEAQSLLLEAFANESLIDISDYRSRDFVLERIGGWLAERTPS